MEIIDFIKVGGFFVFLSLSCILVGIRIGILMTSGKIPDPRYIIRNKKFYVIVATWKCGNRTTYQLRRMKRFYPVSFRRMFVVSGENLKFPAEINPGGSDNLYQANFTRYMEIPRQIVEMKLVRVLTSEENYARQGVKVTYV